MTTFESEQNKRRGFLVGKFMPFHKGHRYFIQKSLEQCDELFILLCFDIRFKRTIPIEIRSSLRVESSLRDICEYTHLLYGFYPEKKTFVRMIDESHIPQYPNGWKEWAKLCTDKMDELNYKPNLVFSSETSYDENYKKYFPKCKHIIIDCDRNSVSTSGTEIRKRWRKWEN